MPLKLVLLPEQDLTVSGEGIIRNVSNKRIEIVISAGLRVERGPIPKQPEGDDQ